MVRVITWRSHRATVLLATAPLAPATPGYLSPTTLSCAGATLSPNPMFRRNKKKRNHIGPRKRNKGNHLLGRAKPVLLTLLPQDLLPTLVHSQSYQLCRCPATGSCPLEELNHRSDSIVLPEPSQGGCPWVLPPAIISYPLPQLPNLRGPRSALDKQMKP